MTAAMMLCGRPALAVQSRLDAEQVVALARDEMRRIGLEDRFRARAPVFEAGRRRWRVVFIRSKPPYYDNGDVLVIIDDDTGRVCVQQGLLRGACS